jgi:hypothetical protein
VVVVVVAATAKAPPRRAGLAAPAAMRIRLGLRVPGLTQALKAPQEKQLMNLNLVPSTISHQKPRTITQIPTHSEEARGITPDE